MACDLTSGFNDRLCADGKGGIKSMVILVLDEIDSITVVANEVTALTQLLPNQGYYYQLRSNLSSYTSSPRRNEENGTTWYDQTLNVVLNSDTKELRAEIDLILKNLCVMLIEKADGTFVLLGMNDGLYMSDGSENTSGVTREDRNGHTLSFVGTESLALPDVASIVAAVLIADAA